MRKAIILAVLLSLDWPAAAQDFSRWVKPNPGETGMEWVTRDSKRAVNLCVGQVRRQLPNSYLPFDAYVTSDGMIHWLGNPSETYFFRKCMAQEGHELENQ